MRKATQKILAIMLTLCMTIGLLPSFVIVPAKAAVPTAISAELRAKFVEMGTTGQITVTDDTGAALEGAELSFSSSNTEVATVNGEGVITPVKMGTTEITVTADFDGIEKTAKVTVPVVGNNLLVVNGVNHGKFEGGIFQTNKTNDKAESKYLWRVHNGGVYERSVNELLPASEVDTPLDSGASVLRMSLPADNLTDANKGNSRIMLEVISGNKSASDDMYGFIEVDSGKLYEYTGWIKSENVPDGKRIPISIENYYYNSLSNASSSGLVAGQQLVTNITPWNSTTGSQDWSFFNTPAPILHESVIGANPRVRNTAASTIGDTYVTDLSFHEVVYDKMVLAASGATSIGVGDTVTLSATHYTNTGNQLQDGYDKDGATRVPIKVTYTSDNTDIATVDANGVVTAASIGDAVISASATIGGVTQTETVTVKVRNVPTDLVYNFYKLETGTNKGIDVKTITDYKYTTVGSADEVNKYVSGDKYADATKKYSDPWKYIGVKDAKFFFASSAYAMMLDSDPESALGGYTQIGIKVPTDGKYQPQIRYGAWTNGTNVRIYIAPASAEDPMAEQYSVGSINSIASSNTWLSRKTLRPVDLTAGDYIVTYQLLGTDAPIVMQRFATSALFLRGIAENPAVELVTDEIEGTLLVNQETELDLTATAADGSVEDLYGLDITATLSDSSMAEVTIKNGDKNVGKKLSVVPLKEGSFTINISASNASGTTAKTSLTISAKESSNIVDQFEARIKNISTGRMALYTKHPIEITKFIDTDGNPMTTRTATVTYTVEPADIAEVSEDGIITGVKEGTGTLTISATGKGDVTKSVVIPITIAKDGENLLVGSNHDFTDLTWMWDQAENAAGKWQTLSIETHPTDADPENRALRILCNPELAMENINAAAFKAGTRVKVESGRMYELSMLVKIEDVVTPYGTTPIQGTIDLYAWNQPSGGSLAGVTYRNFSVTGITNYEEVFEDWARITVHVAAPIDEVTAPGCEYVYMSPRISFQRSNTAHIGQTGFGGTYWIDDMELREVGFDHVEIETVDTLANAGDTATYTLWPYTTTGNKINLTGTQISRVVVPKTSDDMIATVSEGYTTKTSSNVLPALYDVTLNGKNGTAQVGADVTLNGITRSAAEDITVSDQPLVVYSANIELSAYNAVLGDRIQATASGMMSDGTDVNLDEAVVLFNTNDADIAEVDPLTGVITAVGEGEVVISALIKANGVSKTARATLTVTDNTDLVSAKLVASNSKLGENASMKLTLEGTKASGKEAKFDTATVEYIVDEGAEFVEVSNTGVVTGVAMGTAKISAKVTLGDVTITTDPVTITIIKGQPQNFGIDLTSYPAGTPQGLNQAYYDTNGWMIDSTASHAYAIQNMRYQIYGIQVYTTGVGQVFVFKFKAPADGNYYMQFSGGNYKSGASEGGLYIDGSYIGSYNFYNIANNVPNGGTVNMRAMYLTKGEHTLTLRANKPGPTSINMYPGNIQFVGIESLPTVSSLNLNVGNADLDPGETTDLTVNYTLSDGNTHAFNTLLNGEVDPSANVTLSSSDKTVVAINDDGTITGLTTGTATITATAQINGDPYEETIDVVVSNKIFDSVTATLSESTLYVGGTTAVSVVPKYDTGSIIPIERCTVAYSTDTDEFITIDENGLVTAKAAGTTQVTVDVTYMGTTQTAVFDVTSIPTTLDKVIVTAEKTYVKPGDDPVQLTISGRDNVGDLFDITDATCTYASDNTDIATVSETGLVTPGNTVGEAKITVTVDLGGVQVTGYTTIVVTKGKTERTFYTDEKIANAQENIQKYTWASMEKDAAIKAADKYVGLEEKLWNLVTQEGLPRGITVGFQNDPNAYSCAYCGVDLRQKYGNYPWISDALETPWKLQCPDCRRYFPSNDFAGFYNLGINENGKFDHDLAHARNAELVANGEDGYLKNVLYPEKGEGWGVDDGFGYRTGVVFDNGVPECKTWIAYYIHYGVWQTGTNPGIQKILDQLVDAYLYTGEEKYGRVGAILIDRIADVYPDYDLLPYAAISTERFYNSHGGSFEGKIVGRIWETSLAEQFVYAYDAFYPMMDDPYVINFLNQKAEQYNLPNKKETAKDIRQNCEDGILRTVFDAAKKAQIYGNFGMHQSTVCEAAVVLDTMPETKEMIDWVFQDGGKVGNSCTGGNVNAQLTNLVIRDGMGNENAPGYNALWINNTKLIAEALYGYETYNPYNLYENPKFVKMFSSPISLTQVGRNTVQVGDSGAAASLGLSGTSYGNLMLGYIRTGNETLVQALPIFMDALNIELKDLRLGIFEKDPEAIQDHVERVIEEKGPLALDSEYLGGFGFGILRAGEYRDSTDKGKIVDTQRDFWIRNGATNGHGHPDALNLGINAYGLNMAPELGYPEATGQDVNRAQWINSSLSHNTVTIDLKPSTNLAASGKTYHFDNSGRVQLMDMEHGGYVKSYSDGIYRRTFVMVDASDEVSYGVDFFRVKGGDDHIYSFHSQSNEVYETEGVNFVEQKQAVDIDENGNPVYDWVGSYAGIDVPWGEDTAANANERKGTTWLDTIRKDKDVPGAFAIDYQVEDFRGTLPYAMDLHMRVTMLNTDIDEVTLAKGRTPRVASNAQIPQLEWMLARRQGSNLDTLFTTVYEPYKDNRYIENIEAIELKDLEIAKADLAAAYAKDPTKTSSVILHIKDGSMSDNDTAKAVKVSLANDRTDYVIYATNNNVLYTVTELTVSDVEGSAVVSEKDLFDYRGFVGVRTMVGDQIAYTYLNDGDVFGDVSGTPAVTGTIKSFTREMTLENEIVINVDQTIDPATLVDKVIVIENDGVESGTYEILGAAANEDGTITLDIGDITTIRSYNADSTGYIYNIGEGQTFRIPLPTVDGSAPIFTPISDRTGEAGSELKFIVSATAEDGRTVTYKATELPRGAQFDAETGTFAWIPDTAQIGDHHATFIASDGILESAMTVNIEIHSPTGGTSPSAGVTTPGSMGPGSTTTPDDGKTDEEDKPDVTISESDSIDFTASADSANTASTKLGSVEFESGYFAEDGEGTLEISREGNEFDITLDTSAETAEGEMTVTLNYTPGADETDTDAIIVRDADGNIIKDAKYANGKITFTTNSLGQFTVDYNAKRFIDLGNHKWAEDAIYRLAARGVINGTSENTYSPGNAITRADFTTLIVRAFGFTAETTESFPDVESGKYYTDTIAIAKALGIVNGDGKGNFNPMASITRQDMMVIIARAASVAGIDLSGDVENSFPDMDKVSDYAKDAVELLISSGIIAGSNGLINPLGTTTRAEVAVILDRLIFFGR